MSDDQDLIEEISSNLHRLLTPDLERIVFLGKLFRAQSGHQIQLIKSNGDIGYYPIGKNPAKIERAIMDAATRLKSAALFKDQPWSHFKVTVNQGKAIDIDFAYIPEDDDWVGVFMRRVSDLTREEAKAAYIPEKDWLEFKRRRAEKEGGSA